MCVRCVEGDQGTRGPGDQAVSLVLSHGDKETTLLADLEVTVDADAGFEITINVSLQITADVELQQCSIRN